MDRPLDHRSRENYSRHRHALGPLPQGGRHMGLRRPHPRRHAELSRRSSRPPGTLHVHPNPPGASRTDRPYALGQQHWQERSDGQAVRRKIVCSRIEKPVVIPNPRSGRGICFSLVGAARIERVMPVTEVVDALHGIDPIPKERVLAWMREPSLETRGAVYVLSDREWSRIHPELSMEEQCTFIGNYLVECLASDPPETDWVHSGFDAGHLLAGWLQHLYGIAATKSVVANVAA